MSDERLYRSLYGKVLRYLGMRLRSEYEVRNKLVEWLQDVSKYADPVASDMVSPTDVEKDNVLIERIIDQLRRERFLDDERFAREWMVSRLKRGKRGPGVIRMELKQKGIVEELIGKALIDVESEEQGISEEEGARAAASKYFRRLEGKDVREQRMKLYAYLRGKGFSGGVVASVVKEVLNSHI